MEKPITRLSLTIIISLLVPTCAMAQKVKFDEQANAILAENAAAAMLVEKTRTAELDTAKKRKQKVAAALGQIQLFKEMYKKSQRNTLFFNMESTYYKLIAKDMNNIINDIPKFVSAATKRVGIGQLMAIKTGQEITEELEAVFKIYHNIVLGKKYVSTSKFDLTPVDDDGGNHGGGSDDGNGGGGGSGFVPNIGVGSGSGNDEGGGSSSGTGDDNGGGSNPGIGGGHNFEPNPGAIGDRPVGNLLMSKGKVSTYADIHPMDTVNGGNGHGIPIGDGRPSTGGRDGDGLNWLDKQERLRMAVNLHTRLARIHFKMQQFILCSQYYDWKCVLRTYDPHTWRMIYASSNTANNIINKMKNFNFDLK